MRGASRREREQRRQEADARSLDRVNRTPAQQLAVLDRRLGKGVGATKERAKLKAEQGKGQ